ncbi:Dph6-related ATP pyrophosphatase [Pseudothermotoga thermarum]|uniref:ATP binding protein n=1 Tax=Pseudothermotoga thermarum DSM 5069 TaxID=688269 RepID=F7YVV5_9THEM|nr:diphthine--ammonia ligase [Pseudothermotoga thermarum]AEH51777.1 ATP binding protein [Pseudothermotoga thermarum DSM 5069]
MIFCSWSGGKDSCLALYYGIKTFGKVDLLFTMLHEDCDRSRAHGIKKELFKNQASSLKIPWHFECATWDDYEKVFLNFLDNYAKGGIGIFGDIDLEEHRNWVERVCMQKSVRVFEPLWKKDREKILKEFVDLGFKALVVAVSKKFPHAKVLLGKSLSCETIELIKSLRIDICGENGEYHTFVYDGPIFEKPVQFKVLDIVETETSWLLDLRG